MQYTAAALRGLTVLYLGHYGISEGVLSRRVRPTDPYLVDRLFWGVDQPARTQQALSAYLDLTWPDGPAWRTPYSTELAWPPTIPRNRGHYVLPASQPIAQVGLQYTTDELIHLVSTLLEQTGRSHRYIDRQLGREKNGFCGRLMRGERVRAEACRELSEWLNQAWPTRLAWPGMVPRERNNRWLPARYPLVPLLPQQPRSERQANQVRRASRRVSVREREAYKRVVREIRQDRSALAAKAPSDP